MVVVPGENVEVKFAEAVVSPLGMVKDESTVPTYVNEDERPTFMSAVALAGFPLASCNSTKMHL